MDFPQFNKYIIEFTARMIGDGFWMPVFLINETIDDVYQQEQYITIQQNEQPMSDDTHIYDRGYLAGTMVPEDKNYPYHAQIEIQNIDGMYKPYHSKGYFRIENFLYGIEFDIVGHFLKTEPITRLDLGVNYPSAFFGAGTVVTLYGVK